MLGPLRRISILALVMVGSCGDSSEQEPSGPSVASTAVFDSTLVPTSPPATTTTAAPATTAAPPITAAPLTTVDPGTGAAQQYLALVMPVNCAWQRFNEALNTVAGADGQISPDEWRQSGEQVRAAALLGVAAQTDFVQNARAGTWADDLKPYIESLAQGQARVGEYYQRVADAVSPEAFAAVGPPPDAGQEAAALIRAQLGLPSNL